MLNEVPGVLRLVILRSPYDCWNDPRVQLLFDRIIALKLKGYSQEYAYGILPIDTYDFVGTHLAICEERQTKNGSDLIPLMAFKSITLSKASAHSLPFPALALLRASPSDTKAHQRSLETILGRCASEGIEISYDGSWTIDPVIRRNRELTSQLREMMMAVMTYFYDHDGIREHVGCGVLRFKTDRYFQSYGYSLIEDAGEKLPAVNQASLQGEPVVMMHCRNRLPIGDELARKHRALWESRIVLPDLVAEDAPVDVSLLQPSGKAA